MKTIFRVIQILIFYSSAVLVTYCQNSNNSGQTNEHNRFKLNYRLNEISGMALTADERLFAHDDERGIVYQLSMENGQILKFFQIGSFGLEEDFEGLAFANDSFFMITSSGVLYKFSEAENRGKSQFTKYKPNLPKKSEIEGLCYNKESNSLLIAVKNHSLKQYKKQSIIYSFSLDTFQLSDNPAIIIDNDVLKDRFDIKDFYPSAIEIHPVKNTVFVLTSKDGPALIEITLDGEILNAVKLNKSENRQPEAMAIDNKGNLYIANESDGKSAMLNIYSSDNIFDDTDD